ncbi:MAG: YlxR family protein [Armatimonadetes bacterium]|nr:YlxR family protein [Armatimonadota bacterium]
MSEPIRTCIACGLKKPKGELIRTAASLDGEGRGAYVCISAACAERALKRKMFARPLRVGEDAIDWVRLERELMEKVNLTNA